MISKIIASLIIFAIGIFVGIVLCVELGIYDTYSTDILESEYGVTFYTETQCLEFIEDGSIGKSVNKSISENITITKDPHKAISLREQLRKRIKEEDE
jgi:hypothetical protein